MKAVGVCLLFAGLLLFCPIANALPGVPGSSATPVHSEAPQDLLGRTTPRGTVLGFLLAARKGDNDTAAQYLNTRLRGEAAAALAHKLFVVLDRRLPAQLSQLSDQPEGSIRLLTKPNQDLVGTISSDNGNVNIVVERVDRGKGGGSLWLFSKETLDTVPSLYEEVNALVVENAIPQFLTETRIGGIALFEWLAVLVGLPLFYLFTALLNRLLSRIAGRILRRVNRRADLSSPEVLPKPFRLLLLTLMIRWGLSKVTLPLLARELWSSLATVILIAACVWMLILLNGIGEGLLRRRLIRLQQSGATSILRLGRRAIDSLFLFAGIMVGLYHFGVNLTAALAGLGVGGIAIALAAQKTLENVLGGISIIFDKAVRVGDLVKVGDKDGLVEDIGLRSTRIRTFHRTVVSIPNGQLANETLENISIRDKFWFHHTMSLRRETSAPTMRAIIEGVDKLLVQHPRVESGSVRVRFLGFGTSSLDVELFAYIVTSDWSHFLKIQQDLLLEGMQIVQAAGAGLAYPSQTLYLARSKESSAVDGRAPKRSDKPVLPE